MITFPNAKINLGLNIVEKRPDGYHNLETVFYPVPLEDALEINVLNESNEKFRLYQAGLEIEAGEKFDEVIAIGPLVMMKFVCKLTEQYNIPTTVSMNPVMIDGTGMCGGCRVIVGGETKFACVDGPDFDGHKIDWDTAMKRGRMFKDYEEKSCKEGHCRIGRTNHQD